MIKRTPVYLLAGVVFTAILLAVGTFVPRHARVANLLLTPVKRFLVPSLPMLAFGLLMETLLAAAVVAVAGEIVMRTLDRGGSASR